MRTQHVSVFGVATMVLILIATGLATRLAELALVSSMRLTSVGGGGMISPQDVVLALSYTGNTDELVRLLPSLKSLRVPVISIGGSFKATNWLA